MNGFVEKGRWLAKANAYPFYIIRGTFKALFDDGLEDWKALVVLSVARGFAALTLVSVISVGLQHRVLLPDGEVRFLTLWGTIGLGIVIFNYYTLIYERKWFRFEREFRHCSRTVRVLGGVAVWVFSILFVVAAEWMGSLAWKLPG